MLQLRKLNVAKLSGKLQERYQQLNSSSNVELTLQHKQYAKNLKHGK